MNNRKWWNASSFHRSRTIREFDFDVILQRTGEMLEMTSRKLWKRNWMRPDSADLCDAARR